MGFTVGLILMLAATPEGLRNNIMGGTSAMVTIILYGYMLGNLAEAFWPKK